MAEESIEKHVLSKSTFIRGCQCTKSLYLHKTRPDLKDDTSPAQQAIFDKGHEVGKFARELFSGGTDASPVDNFHYAESVTLTRELLKQNTPIIYEAAFQYENVLAATDILVNENGKWKCYEVKSSTEIKDVHILDAALQYYIITESGVMLDDISIVYVNNQYIRKGELEIKQLFIIESVKDKVIALQAFIREKIKELKLVLSSGNIPAEDIGTHCSDPYPCDFTSHCWAHIKEPSVFDLVRLNKNKKFDLYRDGVIEFNQIPKDYKLTEGQKMQVESYLTKKDFINVPSIRGFISNIIFPVYFMDFESFQVPIAMFQNSKAYQQIPFQYSVHLKMNQASDVIHYDFLADATHEDPRLSFIENLLKVTAQSGSILVFNQTFEISRLKELALCYPQFAIEIEERISRIIDLMTPFSKRWYYTSRMNGSYSIKAVLPALIPNLSYADLKISDGQTASSSFLTLYNNTNIDEVNNIRQNLQEYCKLDTFAMVLLFEHLEEL